MIIGAGHNGLVCAFYLARAGLKVRVLERRAVVGQGAGQLDRGPRALEDPDPLRGIARLTASWAAAFALDPDGITRSKTLGTDRMARKLADALPGGPGPLRAAVWEFLRPMLSPRLAALHRGAFVFDQPLETTVELTAHRAESDLTDLDLPDDTEPPAA